MINISAEFLQIQDINNCMTLRNKVNAASYNWKMQLYFRDSKIQNKSVP